MSTNTKAKVTGIYITPNEGGIITEVPAIKAVAGIGLKGDRNYYAQLDLPPEKRVPKKELTLVEQQSVDMLNKSDDFGTVHPGDLRRNLVTTGIDLNSLIGKIFFIGQVKVKGIELCEPCRHLEKLTGKKILKPLVHKGGLRAQILEGGIIKNGNAVMMPE